MSSPIFLEPEEFWLQHKTLNSGDASIEVLKPPRFLQVLLGPRVKKDLLLYSWMNPNPSESDR